MDENLTALQRKFLILVPQPGQYPEQRYFARVS